jgi:hypothetical protein
MAPLEIVPLDLVTPLDLMTPLAFGGTGDVTDLRPRSCDWVSSEVALQWEIVSYIGNWHNSIEMTDNCTELTEASCFYSLNVWPKPLWARGEGRKEKYNEKKVRQVLKSATKVPGFAASPFALSRIPFSDHRTYSGLLREIETVCRALCRSRVTAELSTGSMTEAQTISKHGCIGRLLTWVNCEENMSTDNQLGVQCGVECAGWR